MDALIGGIMIVVGIGMGLLGLMAWLFTPMSSAKKRDTLISYGLLGSGLLLIYFGTKKIR